MQRRTFLQTACGGAFAGLAGAAKSGIRLGLDAYSVRAYGWTAMELLDYAAKLKLDTVQMSAPGNYESLDPAYLRRVKARADELGIVIDAAIGKMCPTTGKWNRKESPEEYVALGLDVANAMGATAMRTYMGGGTSRVGDLPFEAHLEASLKVLRAVRSRALDYGIKIAIENHSDFEARELRAFIEEAGTDYVGCCLDTGNPMRLLEDPLLTVEVLGPVTVTSHFRDSVLYAHPRGAAFQWVAMGDGSIDFRPIVKKYRELCPKAPVQLEIITGRPPAVLPYFEDEIWKAMPDKPAADFARFEKLVRDGHPFMGTMVVADQGKPPEIYREALKLQQSLDVERSVDYCKKSLGLGLR